MALKRNKKVLVIWIMLIFFSNSSYAGFLDKLKKELEKSVDEITNEIVEGDTGNNKDEDAAKSVDPQLTEEKSSPTPVDTTQLPRLDGHKAILLKARFRPESFALSDDRISRTTDRLNEAARRLYGEDYYKIGNRSDDPNIRKALPKFRERLLKDAKQVPTIYRHVIFHGKPNHDWYKKRYYERQLEGYSFSIPLKQTIVVTFNKLPFKGTKNKGEGSATLQIIPVSPERLKTLIPADCEECNIWGELVYEVTGYPEAFGIYDNIYETNQLIAVIKYFRFYGKGPRYGSGDPLVLGNLIHEVPIDKMPANEMYIRYGGMQ